MFRFLMPREESFFTFFERHIALTIEGCRHLVVLATPGADVHEQVLKIKEIEHKADDVAHECIIALHKTFITPFDRSDIHRLIRRLDDIIDKIDSAAARIDLYEVGEIRHEVKEIAEVLVKATGEIEKALVHLRRIKDTNEIDAHCVAIHEAENEGDAILRRALARLFKEEESRPVAIMKWRQIFELLERATDRCDDVSNIIQGIVIEAS